jgi:hypothetical protein
MFFSLSIKSETVEQRLEILEAEVALLKNQLQIITPTKKALILCRLVVICKKLI